MSVCVCLMNGYFRGYSYPLPRITEAWGTRRQGTRGGGKFLVVGESKSELIRSFSVSNANWLREVYWLTFSKGQGVKPASVTA